MEETTPAGATYRGAPNRNTEYPASSRLHVCIGESVWKLLQQLSREGTSERGKNACACTALKTGDPLELAGAIKYLSRHLAASPQATTRDSSRKSIARHTPTDSAVASARIFRFIHGAHWEKLFNLPRVIVISHGACARKHHLFLRSCL